MFSYEVAFLTCPVSDWWNQTAPYREGPSVGFTCFITRCGRLEGFTCFITRGGRLEGSIKKKNMVWKPLWAPKPPSSQWKWAFALTLQHMVLQRLLYSFEIFWNSLKIFIWLHWILVAVCGIFSCSMQTLSCKIWDLVPWLGIEPMPSVLGAQNLSQLDHHRHPIKQFWVSEEPPSF